MLQPFELFKATYIDKLVELKKIFLVTQTYNRGQNNLAATPQIPIIISAYDDLGLAKTHLNAVRSDRYASIIMLQKEKHRLKLLEMLQPSSSYLVFWAVVKNAGELEKRVNSKYKDNMRRYIEKHTTWRIERNNGIQPSIQLVFGYLYIILKHANQTLRVSFEEIENA